jgi:hypothetical protein
MGFDNLTQDRLALTSMDFDNFTQDRLVLTSMGFDNLAQDRPVLTSMGFDDLTQDGDQSPSPSKQSAHCTSTRSQASRSARPHDYAEHPARLPTTLNVTRCSGRCEDHRD